MSRERFMKTAEVASILQVSPKTISRWAKEGRLAYMSTLGGHRRFKESQIQQLTDDLNRPQTMKPGK